MVQYCPDVQSESVGVRFALPTVSTGVKTKLSGEDSAADDRSAKHMKKNR